MTHLPTAGPQSRLRRDRYRAGRDFKRGIRYVWTGPDISKMRRIVNESTYSQWKEGPGCG